MSKIITVANRKGGVGKTTVTMVLAGALAEEGYSVCVVDADPQGTAVRWAASADDETPFPAMVVSLADAGKTVGRQAKKLAQGYDVLIIDCPPSVESVVPASAMSVSDLVLLPVVPSPPDLWAAVGIKQVVDQVQAIHDFECRLVLNMSQPNTTATQEVVEALGEFDIPLLENGELCLRTAYRQCAGYGTHPLVHKPTDSKAVDEVLCLVDSVSKILKLEVPNG